MGLQRISQQFRGRTDPLVGGSKGVVNTIDEGPITPSGQTVPAFTSQYTNGTTLVDQPSLQTIGRNWKLLSVAFRAALSYGAGFEPQYGKLGKVYAGVDISGTLNPSGPLQASAGSIPPWRDLPNDVSLVSTLWDPAIDPLPPHSFALGPLNTGLAATSIIQLPVPLPVHDTPISIGIWVERSLFASPLVMTQFTAFQGISVWFAGYTLNFDDGQ